MYDTPLEIVLPSACAIELIHTCSLILDDLPCMDNAKIRRGKITNHQIFGENIAILASIALLNLSYGLIASTNGTNKIEASLLIRVSKEISEAVGTLGVIGGQAVDLIMDGKKIDFHTLEYIHSHKTGALFIAASRIGSILGRSSNNELNVITKFAKNLGLAFQIMDDLLDHEGLEARVGKDLKSDIFKTTFITLLGVGMSRKLVNELTDFSLSLLDIFGDRAKVIRELVNFLQKRDS
jgi:geranylgeranyl diphosphate synthase type II